MPRCAVESRCSWNICYDYYYRQNHSSSDVRRPITLRSRSRYRVMLTHPNSKLPSALWNTHPNRTHSFGPSRVSQVGIHLNDGHSWSFISLNCEFHNKWTTSILLPACVYSRNLWTHRLFGILCETIWNIDNFSFQSLWNNTNRSAALAVFFQCAQLLCCDVRINSVIPLALSLLVRIALTKQFEAINGDLIWSWNDYIHKLFCTSGCIVAIEHRFFIGRIYFKARSWRPVKVDAHCVVKLRQPHWLTFRNICYAASVEFRKLLKHYERPPSLWCFIHYYWRVVTKSCTFSLSAYCNGKFWWDEGQRDGMLNWEEGQKNSPSILESREGRLKGDGKKWDFYSHRIPGIWVFKGSF